MANSTIDTLIQKIRTAIYGKEVRDAIADGISTCYTDVSQGKTLIDGAVETANTAATNANSKAAIAQTAAANANAAADEAREAASEVSNTDRITYREKLI